MGKLMDALTYPGCTLEETAAIIAGERKKSYVNMMLDEVKIWKKVEKKLKRKADSCLPEAAG